MSPAPIPFATLLAGLADPDNQARMFSRCCTGGVGQSAKLWPFAQDDGCIKRL